jgi:hypothetical protein
MMGMNSYPIYERKTVMSLGLGIIDVVSIAGTALIIGIIANSRNSIGLVNAVANLFGQTFGAAAGTIR